jgi:hypothetical protein
MVRKLVNNPGLGKGVRTFQVLLREDADLPRIKPVESTHGLDPVGQVTKHMHVAPVFDPIFT